MKMKMMMMIMIMTMEKKKSIIQLTFYQVVMWKIARFK